MNNQLIKILILCFIYSSYNIKIDPVGTSLYHTQLQLDQQYQQLSKKYPEQVKLRKCAKDNVSYNIIDINSTSVKNSKILKAVVTCNIHAREIFTSEVCLSFVKQLLQSQNQTINNIRKHVQFTFFYMGNEMHDRVLTGQYCRRTDSNGVDINRNFPTGFSKEQKDSETNPGPAPLSEPFSQCIDQQVKQKKPDIFLDVHDGQFSLYTYTKNTDEQSKKQSVQVLKQVTKACQNCRVRQDDQQGVMYSDIKSRYKIKWSNLFQIYGGYNEAQKKSDIYCWTMFNPRTKLSYNFYINRGKQMLKNYFKAIIKFENK